MKLSNFFVFFMILCYYGLAWSDLLLNCKRERREIMGTFFEDRLETASGERVKIRVPSAQGGTDRTIYKNGIDSGYYLGDSNDHVYRNGHHVADCLVSFVKMRFWRWELYFEVAFCTSFLLQNSYILYNKFIKNNWWK